MMTKIKEAEQKIKSLEEQLLLVSEKYRRLREVICPIEGLSITLEYKKGETTIANRHCFSLNDVENGFNFSNQIVWQSSWLWSAIEKQIKRLAID